MAQAKKLKKDKKPAQNGVMLVNLTNGEKHEYEHVRRVQFAGERPTWAVMHRYNAEGTSSAEMLLVDLRSGTVSTVGSVGEFDLDDSGNWLAWTSETKDRVGNGISVRNLTTDVVRTLDSDEQLYRRLAWSDSGFALAVLRGRPDSAASDTAYAVIGWANATVATPARR